LVKFACIIGDRGRAVGYGGGGAIFGSKNLKAIAIRGTLPVRIAHTDKFIQKLRCFKENVVEKSKTVDFYRKGGTLLPYLAPGENRPHGVKNMGAEFWSNEAINCVTRDKFDRYLKRRHSCFNCPSYCSGIYDIKGLKCEGVQANTLRALGSNLDIRSTEDILYTNALLNMYGIDTDQTSAVIGWAIECFENGILNINDTDGIELRWGKGDSVIKLINNIVFRKGFGNILADGVYEASKVIGRGSEKYTVLVKKNSLMEAGMRSHKGWALGIVTSTKGGGHLRGAPGQEIQNIPREISEKLFGIGDISDPTSYENKAELVTWQENYKGVIDMMGLCVSNSMWMDISLFTPDDIAEFFNYTTGENVSGNYLMQAGAKLQNI
jgi:aldehyde:ferredoxin oxidoreductase